jgi:hypothetical protein
MAGLGLFVQKNAIAATMPTPISTAFKFCITCRNRKNGLLNRLPIEVTLGFVQGDGVTTASLGPENTFWGLNFLFCAKAHLGHHGITWSILHGISTKNYKEIEANPSTLGRLHFSGKTGTTQP